MNTEDIINCNDKSLFDDIDYMPLSKEKEFYTPEEAYELVMSDIHSVYSLKHAV